MHSFDEGKRRFRDLVSRAKPSEPQLPLVHSTDAYALGDILDTGEIVPQTCGVFVGEDLLYFFYGKPAFRPNIFAEPTSLAHYFPICFIFKPELAATIKRIFPFDSGGFRDFYSKYMHKQMKLGDFGLEPDPKTPGQVVTQFFGSNPAYLMGRANPADLDAAHFEAQSYSAMIVAKGSDSFDSRGSSIELQTGETVSITDMVAAVILPGQYDTGILGETLRGIGIETIPYRVTDRSRPNEYVGTVTDLCLRYYVAAGIVQEEDL